MEIFRYVEKCPANWKEHFDRLFNQDVYRKVAERENYTGPTK